MSTNTPDLTTFKKTFFPYATQAGERVQKSGCRFAYYTTAATAIQILSGPQIWMRNTLVMNDFMEVEHGLVCVLNAYESGAGKKLNNLLESAHPGLADEIRLLFQAWIPNIRSDTFVTCLSEHSAEDDQYGRLSMWRAYGGIAGVAFVLNGGVLFRESRGLAAYTSPVAYLDGAGFEERFSQVVDNIAANSKMLCDLGRAGVKDTIFQMLRYAAVCTKHPAFEEEREWRVIASPTLESSPLLQECVEIVGGVPQKVLKIKLEDHSDQNLIAMNPDALIERVLIGPCEHADVIWKALCQVLSNAGVRNPQLRIFHTGIPLRTNQR